MNDQLESGVAPSTTLFTTIEPKPVFEKVTLINSPGSTSTVTVSVLPPELPPSGSSTVIKGVSQPVGTSSLTS